jgi:hypothetical protein
MAFKVKRLHQLAKQENGEKKRPQGCSSMRAKK